MKRTKFLSICLAIMVGVTSFMQAPPQTVQAASETTPIVKNTFWDRPVIVPIPKTTAGVADPVISLNGEWEATTEINSETLGEKDSLNVENLKWRPIKVPGEMSLQGFNIEQDKEYPYKKEIDIPADFADKKIILRFDAVYSDARLWVNGKFVREHTGGFTAWNADITEYVKAGETAEIVVGVTDKSDDISAASKYAKHNIGGILRNVSMIALPEDYVTRFHATTDFDAEYKDATLNVILAMDFDKNETAEVLLNLKDPQGKKVDISNNRVQLEATNPGQIVKIPVSAPQKWDAEHPNLYTLDARIVVDNNVLQTLSKEIGFRKVERDGKNVYVNGNEVKLRGVNAHDVHPVMGRATTDELDASQLEMYKSANVNFVRTSHYPRTDAFLEAANRIGLYVEEETAVVWQGGHDGNQITVNNKEFEARYMNQLTEMIEKDLSHPSIIIWSLGNETTWGENIRNEFDYVREEDPTRLTVFSWGDKVADIYSQHYPSIDEVKEPWKYSGDQPVLFDEYVHVNSYNFDTQKRDPGLRNYWGESIKRFWENIFETDGALGGAIWSSPDDVFESELHGTVGYGEWGIIDGWRREKPEHWLTKKAYSPIRIADEAVVNPGNNEPLIIPIKNWFDSTNLNEVTFEWQVGNEAGKVNGADIKPHESGNLIIPARQWTDGEILNIKVKINDELVDEFNLPIGDAIKTFAANPQGAAPAVETLEDEIIVKGDHFQINFSKQTGMITNGSYNSETIITGGPRLHLGYANLDKWSLTNIKSAQSAKEAIITITGKYGNVNVVFTLKIDNAGLITNEYTVTNLPGGETEAGIIYNLVDNVDKFSWDRQGLWSAYPEDHIGRTTGFAKKDGGRKNEYKQEPTWSWSEDTQDFFLYGAGDKGDRGSNDFRSMKENINYGSVILRDSQNRLRAESYGTDAVRMITYNTEFIDDRDSRIVYSSGWGESNGSAVFKDSLNGTEKFSNEAGKSVELTFSGTSISLYGAKSNNTGKFNVYIDGKLVDEKIDTYATVKLYEKVLFNKSDLENGEHTIKIEVTGEKNKNAVDAFIVVDGFEVSSPTSAMLVNNEWSYKDNHYTWDWGNYMPEVKLSDKYSNTVKVRLTDNDDFEYYRVDDNNNNVKYSGTWGEHESEWGINPGYKGTEHFSNEPGATAEYTFNGTQVRLFGHMRPDMGIAEIKIDGETVGEVDLYSPTKQYSALLFESNKLELGEHKIEVKVTGKKNEKASNTYVIVDAFENDGFGLEGRVSKSAVRFDSNGGSAVDSITVETGSRIAEPQKPVNGNLEFLGWYKDAEFDVAWDFAKDTVDEDITLYAKWEEDTKPTEQFIVTFESNGGSKVDTKTVNSGSKIAEPARPTKKDHKFIGWYKDAEFDVAWDFANDTVEADITLYAKWEEDTTPTEQFTVTFESNGGSKVDTKTVYSGSKIAEPATPTKKDHKFLGWYKDAGFGEVWDFANDTVDADITLYAKWEEDTTPTEQFIVTFESNGGSKVDTKTVNSGSKIAEPARPTKKDHKFIGWYKDTEFDVAWDFANNTVEEDITLYAKWEEDTTPTETVTVTFESNGGITVDDRIVQKGSKLENLSSPTKVGHNFLGWYKDKELKEKWNVETDTVKADITLYAKWELKSTPTPNPTPSIPTPTTKPSDPNTILKGIGGKVEAEGLTVNVPAKAANSDVQIKIKKLKAEEIKNEWKLQQEKLVGSVIEVTKNTKGSFAAPITITMKFDPKTVDSTNTKLVIVGLDEKTNKWVELDNVKVNYITGTISGTTMDVTKFAVMKEQLEIKPEIKPVVELKDIVGHWAEQNINKLIRLGAVNGFVDQTFMPDSNVTRAQFVTMLVKVLDLEKSSKLRMTDVNGHWAEDAIAMAVEHGFVQGFEDKTFRPDDVITREQMAVMLVKAFELDPKAGALDKKFKDATKISNWAASYVATAAEHGLLSGFSDGTIKPNANATRAQAVTVIIRALGL
ncbi:InlB B-repeat-containing protein [Paenibacillus yanchengensis]|uniref:beta-galactosidase n=1 Tax=Paenibacillus yanchengensis TaxID=2035833 RepID=A0ABW4YIT0_9BACL